MALAQPSGNQVQRGVLKGVELTKSGQSHSPLDAR